MRVAKLMYAEHGIIRPYSCAYCGGWHLTSMQRSVTDTAIEEAVQVAIAPEAAEAKTERIRRRAERTAGKRKARAVIVFEEAAEVGEDDA